MRAWMDRALRDIMHVHFYGAKEVDRRRKAYWEEIIPDDWDKKTTVKRTVPWSELGKFLKCEHLQLRSFRDWHRAINGTREEWKSVSALAYWDAPAFLQISVTRRLGLYSDWPIYVSMAVVGDGFDIKHILNEHQNRIDDETLYNTHDLYEYRFMEIEENYLYNRPIKVLSRRECNGFSIFDFEVREK